MNFKIWFFSGIVFVFSLFVGIGIYYSIEKSNQHEKICNDHYMTFVDGNRGVDMCYAFYWSIILF